MLKNASGWKNVLFINSTKKIKNLTNIYKIYEREERVYQQGSERCLIVSMQRSAASELWNGAKNSF